MSNLLRIYLRDHHAGSRAGIRLAERLAANPDPAIAQTGARLRDEIQADIGQLEHVMQLVDARPSRIKDLLVVVGERAGRLKPNGRLLTRSPLSDLLEIEALLLGVTGKRELWRALRGATSTDARLAGVDFESLEAVAGDQIARLEELHRGAAAGLRDAG
jgi:hypothetical protein